MPKVSIIILNWNGLEDTIECLESVKGITYPNYEVIVVDNGSSGNDAQVLKEKFGDWAHIIENDKNYGFCGGNNIGMKYALDDLYPDYLVLLNNDTIVAPELVTELVKVTEADPAIGIAGARMYFYDDPDRWYPFWGKVNFLYWLGVERLRLVRDKIKRVGVGGGQYDPVREVEWVPGACFLIKKKVVEDIGLLDEDYFCYMEEIDFHVRAKKAGYKIVDVPRAKFWHKFKQSSKKVSGLSFYYMMRNRFRLTRKHATRWQYWWSMIYFFGLHLWLATAYYLILRHSPRLLLSYYRGVRDGLFNSKAMARFYSNEL